jgi:hypothetical protein
MKTRAANKKDSPPGGLRRAAQLVFFKKSGEGGFGRLFSKSRKNVFLQKAYEFAERRSNRRVKKQPKNLSF